MAKRVYQSCSRGEVARAMRVSGKGALSLLVYLPGRRRKKKAMMIISAAAATISIVEVDCTMTAMRRSTWIGMGLTHKSAGSEVFHALMVRWRWKSMT